MDCKEKILSDEYVDIVVDFPVDILLTEGLDICYIPLGEGYSVVYDNLLTAESRWRGAYQYRFTPKVYGLMELEPAQAGDDAQVRMEKAGEMRAAQLFQEPFDATPLISSGILSVQREPLSLTGRGAFSAVLTRGWTILLLFFAMRMAVQEYWRYGIRPSRTDRLPGNSISEPNIPGSRSTRRCRRMIPTASSPAGIP